MMKVKFKRSPVNARRDPKRRVWTRPDQGLTVKDMLDRFVRHLPSVGSVRDAVYVDQSEFDLEKVSRMDPGEKFEFAAEMKARAQNQQAELDARAEAQRKAKEEALQADFDKRAAEKAAKKKKDEPEGAS